MRRQGGRDRTGREQILRGGQDRVQRVSGGAAFRPPNTQAGRGKGEKTERERGRERERERDRERERWRERQREREREREREKMPGQGSKQFRVSCVQRAKDPGRDRKIRERRERGGGDRVQRV